jgi:lipoprotein-anchoring transpeptidase ErfK/SrfK
MKDPGDVDPRAPAATFVLVDRDACTLTLFEQRRVARRYRVTVGREAATPVGMHRIVSKEVDPTWYAPERRWTGELAGKVVPPSDPRNPLKARFLGLGVRGVRGVRYGIHGTSEDSSIGSRASPGCIRMRVPDVIELFDRVHVGTRVLIL